MTVTQQTARRGFGNGRTATRPPLSPIAEVLDVDQSMVPLSGGGVVEAMTRGEIDIQIRTAKAYPRDVTSFLLKLETLATRDVETAESCFYTLKRKDRSEPGGSKKIQGPSIRFAEILVACWGHMRIAGITAGEDDRFITLRGMAWDLETNSAFSVDVKRRITTREGHTYSDDMIGVTSNAGVSIATRNAILHVIPGAFWKPVYDKCLVVARGDAKTLAARRAHVLEYFQKQHKKSAADVFAYLGIRGEADFTLEHLEEMQGLRTALKDGETTIEEAFSDVTPGAEPQAPEVVIAGELGCSVEHARAVHAGFEALALAPAQRSVNLKKFKGNVDALLVLLRDMSGQPLPVESAAASSNGTAAAAAAPTTETPAAAQGATTTTAAAPAPAVEAAGAPAAPGKLWNF